MISAYNAAKPPKYLCPNVCWCLHNCLGLHDHKVCHTINIFPTFHSSRLLTLCSPFACVFNYILHYTCPSLLLSCHSYCPNWRQTHPNCLLSVAYVCTSLAPFSPARRKRLTFCANIVGAFQLP